MDEVTSGSCPLLLLLVIGFVFLGPFVVVWNLDVLNG